MNLYYLIICLYPLWKISSTPQLSLSTRHSSICLRSFTCWNYLCVYSRNLSFKGSFCKSFLMSSFRFLSNLVQPFTFSRNFISAACVLFFVNIVFWTNFTSIQYNNNNNLIHYRRFSTCFLLLANKTRSYMCVNKVNKFLHIIWRTGSNLYILDLIKRRLLN